MFAINRTGIGSVKSCGHKILINFEQKSYQICRLSTL